MTVNRDRVRYTLSGSGLDLLPGVYFRRNLTPPWQPEWLNNGLFELCGYEPRGANDSTQLLSVIPLQQQQRLQQQIETQLKSQSEYRIEYDIRHKEGSIRHLEERGQRCPDNPTLIEGFWQDISERTQMSRQLHEQQEKLQLELQLSSSKLQLANQELKQSLLNQIELKEARSIELQRIQSQQQTLSQLVDMAASKRYDFPQLLQEICSQCCRILRADRLGVWIFDEQSAMGSLLYELDHDSFVTPPAISPKTHPELMEFLRQQRILLLHPGDHPEVASELLSLASPEMDNRLMFAPLTGSSQSICGAMIAVNNNSVRSWHSDERFFLASIADFLELQIMNQEKQGLLDELRAFRNAVEQSNSGVMMLNPLGEFTYVNHAFSNITGFQPEELIGERLLSRLQLVQSSLVDQLKDTLIVELKEWQGEVRARSKQGSLYWAHMTITPVLDEHGQICQFMGVYLDTTGQKSAQEHIEKLAFSDPLTGLENRQLFQEKLQQALHNCERTQSHIALLFLDLDNFKRINDSLGHRTGDQLLIQVAARIKACVRTSDGVARIGGDEFTILLMDIDKPSHAGTVAQNLLTILSKPFYIDDHQIMVSASLGITLAPDDGTDISSIMRHADLAMYKAKSQGKNTLQFFTEAMNDEAQLRLFLENELRSAMHNNELFLNLQPKVDLADGTVCGMEALLRWKHPERGMIPPDHFIPIAEDTGQIIDIGYWIIRRCCDYIVQLTDRGYGHLTLAVNLSARQFREPSLIETIEMAICESGINPHQLEFEITESMLMDKVDQAIEQMHQLKRIGVTLSIDDFGTGYSSLAYLRQFPIDLIKVDRAFVKDIPNNSSDMAITAAIIAMAHRLNLRVVAEGVETAEQQDFLRQQLCSYAQGYFYSKPLDFSQLLEQLPMLDQRNEAKLFSR
ncbi:EAL domain-containing protein [Aestuariirhabdus sp. Z084]|uniref:sensor domain-containing protein n=1 Tax=Aestuariirhabdus haliotis TaxID=2918751 RepID=UPI00201B3CF4|nr:EAL domain-containing protein [Aestuariirhabdus haliotis]MCL6416818.1 EAL domain-containing protein [Aestuariirhabdus haliotis]MCL6420818.1 EAL domain-containing protein [Aestuariirhabdus haliotis]